MITWHLMKWVSIDLYYREGECLSTDPKPTEGMYNGSKLAEMDTGKLYMYNAAGGAWIEWGS